MSTDETIAESSTAIAEPQAETPAIESWTGEQRSAWLRTGTMPESPKPAESAPATEDSAAVDTAETPSPVSETGVKQEQAPARKRALAEDRKAELARDIQDLLRQRAELRAELTSKPGDKLAESPAAPEVKPAAAGKPAPPDAASWTGTWDELETAKLEYAEKLADWKVEQALASRDQKVVRDKIAATWNERATKVRESDPEFEDAVTAVGPFLTRAGVADLVMQSEVGPQIVQHLFANREDGMRIAQLGNSVLIAREIGKLEAALSTKAPVTRKITSASKPPTELSAKATAPADEARAAVEQGDFGRYRRLMNAREKG